MVDHSSRKGLVYHFSLFRTCSSASNQSIYDLYCCRESFGYPLSSVAGKEMIREREEKAESSSMFDPFNRNEEYASHVYEGF